MKIQFKVKLYILWERWKSSCEATIKYKLFNEEEKHYILKYFKDCMIDGVWPKVSTESSDI